MLERSHLPFSLFAAGVSPSLWSKALPVEQPRSPRRGALPSSYPSHCCEDIIAAKLGFKEPLPQILIAKPRLEVLLPDQVHAKERPSPCCCRYTKGSGSLHCRCCLISRLYYQCCLLPHCRWGEGQPPPCLATLWNWGFVAVLPYCCRIVATMRVAAPHYSLTILRRSRRSLASKNPTSSYTAALPCCEP